MLVNRMIKRRRFLATLFMGVAGILGGALLALLVGNVATRAVGLNPVWVSETSRVLFVWGTAAGMISVSLSGSHFRVVLGNKVVMEAEAGAGYWELAIQIAVCAVLSYIAWFAYPTIERAATQPMASIPLTYGFLRTALVVALCGMLVAHFWRVFEIVLSLATVGASPQREG